MPRAASAKSSSGITVSGPDANSRRSKAIDEEPNAADAAAVKVPQVARPPAGTKNSVSTNRPGIAPTAICLRMMPYSRKRCRQTLGKSTAALPRSPLAPPRRRPPRRPRPAACAAALLAKKQHARRDVHQRINVVAQSLPETPVRLARRRCRRTSSPRSARRCKTESPKRTHVEHSASNTARHWSPHEDESRHPRGIAQTMRCAKTSCGRTCSIRMK